MVALEDWSLRFLLYEICVTIGPASVLHSLPPEREITLNMHLHADERLLSVDHFIATTQKL